MKLISRFNSDVRQSRLLFLPFVAMVSSCSTLVPTADTQIDVVPEVVAVEPQPDLATEQNRGEGLTADLLYELLLSSIAFQEGEIDVAAEALIRAARSTQDPVVIARAVRMAVHNKSYDQAVELGLRWIDLVPKGHQAYIITALAAVMNQQAETATEIINSLLAQDAELTGLRFGQLGEVFLQHAEGETALDVLLQLANQYSEQAEAWLLVAGMAQKNKNFQIMDSALDRILLLEPGSEKAAAFKLLALADSEAAQEQFATAFLKEYPDTNIFRMQYAQLLLRNENDKDALAQLLILLKRDPENSEAMNLIALLYQARENFEKAAEYFALRIKTIPGDDRSRLYLANVYQQLERYDQAKAILGEVSDINEVFNAGRQMSLLIEQTDGVEEALAYLQTLQVNTPTHRVQLTVDHELMLQRAGRDEEAYDLINKTLEQYPDNDTLRYHRALNTVEREDLESHEADMRILLSHKPGDPHYNNTLGYTLLVMSDRLEEAAELINKAHELEPEDPYILDSKGWLEYKLNNLDLALEYLNRAFALDQDAEIAAHIGEVYWAQGNEEKAREFWNQGDRIDPTNKSLLETKARFLN